MFSSILKHTGNCSPLNGKNDLQGWTNFAWAKTREKLILEMSLDYEDLINCEFIPEGQTVNKKLISTFQYFNFFTYKTPSGGITLKNGRETIGFCSTTMPL